MLVSALVLFANMADFISCELRMNIWLSLSATNESSLFFVEATALVKLNEHPLLHNLADRDQILCDVQYMQEILNICWVAFFAKWKIADMSNWMSSVVSSFDIAGSI